MTEVKVPMITVSITNMIRDRIIKGKCP